MQAAKGKQIYIVKWKQKIAGSYIKYTYIPKQEKEFEICEEVKGAWTENILIDCK